MNGDVFDGRWILGKLKHQGFVDLHVFFHVQERGCAIFERVTEEPYFQVFGLQGSGGIELLLGLVGQGEFCCWGD